MSLSAVMQNCNLAICWKIRVSNSTHLEVRLPSSENLLVRTISRKDLYYVFENGPERLIKRWRNATKS